MSGEGRDLDPVSVVRAWLEAPEERARDFLTGPVHDYEVLRDGIEGTYAMTRRPPVVRALALREQADAYAVCDLDAELTYDVVPALGAPVSFSRTVGGPVVLGRTAEGWRIADYTTVGRRAVESSRVYGPDARIELDGFTVTPLGLGLPATGTLFVFEVANRGSGDLVVRGVTAPAGALGRSQWTYLDGRRTVRPGETVRLEAQAQQVLSVTTPEVRLAMPVKPARGRVHLVRLTLPFAKRDAEPRARTRKLIGLSPRAAWAINVAVLLGILLLLGLPDWVPRP
jgi:hypothetical protein